VEASRSEPNWAKAIERTDEPPISNLTHVIPKPSYLSPQLTSNFTVLSEVELQRTSDGLHNLGLGSGTDTRHGKTDVDSRSDTLEEELGLQEDLTVGDGNDVGRNVGGHITTLG
jgi:hypothetical protein